MLHRLGNGYACLLAGCGLCAGMAIAAMAVLITLDVVLRNLQVFNFPWLLEVCEYVLFVSTFLAAPWVLRQGAHVRVDLLLEVVPAPIARALEYAANIGGLTACILLAHHGLRIAWVAFSRGDMLFKELVIPEWPLLAVIPVSAVLLAVEFVRRIALAATGGQAEPVHPRAESP